jgi:hypothetical protein
MTKLIVAFAILRMKRTIKLRKPEFAGSNPAEAVGFFGHPENPHYAFLRKGSKIICPMSHLCGM